jgi:1-deoxy-D-xylulose-5-phosphate synthase
MGILEKIKTTKDLQIVRKELMPELAKEIREEIIRTVSKNGGHLASSLGAVELAIALHYVFDTPKDKIIWDVGHQAYAHKLLTGRYDKFSTLRTYGGLSGFPRREESEYDPISVGHSSTAISAALGIAAARDLNKQDYKVIAVIGDGSMTGGLAFEGLQNAGHLGTDLLVILNDNEMFISHRVGAVAGYLAKLLTAGSVKNFEKKVEQFIKRIHFWGSSILKVAKRFKVLLFPGMLFEEMGFSYLGPVDGHDIFAMMELLSSVKKLKGPVLLHVITKKGKGYLPAENEPTRFHGIGRFNIITGESEESGKTPSYTEVFGKTLLRLAREDDKIVAITAAMPQGTGLDDFSKEFKNRFFDVGIAESHALTFAAGLASAGAKPVVSLYSTFLQRGFDQVLHDIAMQKLPVVICVDRAGIVGEDGATHQGSFDLSYLSLVPNLTIMAPADENELQHMLKTALSLNGPVAIRYPRGSGIGLPLDKDLKILPTGKSVMVKQGGDAFIFAIGNMVNPSLEAAKLLDAKNISTGVVNVRFLKPFDRQLLLETAFRVKQIVGAEENSILGGLNSELCQALAGTGTNIVQIGLPDAFIEHGSQKILREKYGLTAEKMAERISKVFEKMPAK